MGALIVYLAYMGLQLFFVDHVNPLHFLFSADWTSDPNRPGALVFIVGSVSITLFAICVGGPFGVAVGIFLSQLAPKRLRVHEAGDRNIGRHSVGRLRLARPDAACAVDSSRDGKFDRLRLGDGRHRALDHDLADGDLALRRRAARRSRSLKEGSMALGATRWQTIWNVMLPAARSGLTVAVILGIARAIGEALAVQMVIGNSAMLPKGCWRRRRR